MIFLTNQDFLSLIDEATLNVVTEGTETAMDEAENRAIEEMKSYLNVRHDAESIFSSPEHRNELVVMYLCDIALYHMHTRIVPDNIPKLRKERYHMAKEWLDKVVKGFISPALPKKADENPTPVRHGASQPRQNFYY